MDIKDAKKLIGSSHAKGTISKQVSIKNSTPQIEEKKLGAPVEAGSAANNLEVAPNITSEDPPNSAVSQNPSQRRAHSKNKIKAKGTKSH
jgi:hypothetical protein